MTTPQDRADTARAIAEYEATEAALGTIATAAAAWTTGDVSTTATLDTIQSALAALRDTNQPTTTDHSRGRLIEPPAVVGDTSPPTSPASPSPEDPSPRPIAPHVDPDDLAATTYAVHGADDGAAPVYLATVDTAGEAEAIAAAAAGDYDAVTIDADTLDPSAPGGWAATATTTYRAARYCSECKRHDGGHWNDCLSVN